MFELWSQQWKGSVRLGFPLILLVIEMATDMGGGNTDKKEKRRDKNT